VIFPGWEERRAMKASKFSDAQKAFILKQGDDGAPERIDVERIRRAPERAKSDAPL